MAVAHEVDSNQVCGVCGRKRPARDLLPVELVQPQIAEFLYSRTPDWGRTGKICRSDLTEARRGYVEDLLMKERGELTNLDTAVVDSIARHETLSSDVHAEYVETRSFGDRLADQVARTGGSWGFIVSFAIIVIVWMAFNSIALFTSDRFDPYPYILLNLALSCLAAVQAPLIMMSQRRQEAKDRLRAENDYRVNLKAELEIRHLHEKVDHLLLRQWERLAAIQKVQIELMEDLAKDRRR